MPMKLHELLAVESHLESQANKCRTELAATFQGKRHLFEQKRVTFTSIAEGAAPVTEEQSDIQTTVGKELDWIRGFYRKSLDASYQVAEANTVARADIILEDGKTLVQGVPATALLELEKRLGELHELAKAIPILDPAKGFTLDKDTGEGIYKARHVQATRTAKKPRAFVKYEATKEHPAQVEIVSEDLPTGTIAKQEWSSMFTPAEKADLIDRIEIAIRAVRRARARANETAVPEGKHLADPLLKYLFG